MKTKKVLLGFPHLHLGQTKVAVVLISIYKVNIVAVSVLAHTATLSCWLTNPLQPHPIGEVHLGFGAKVS